MDLALSGYFYPCRLFCVSAQNYITKREIDNLSKPLRSIMDPVERAATISRRAQNYYITIEDKNGNPKEVGGLGYWSAKAAQKHKEITRRV